MNKIKSYEDLIIWQKSIILVENIYLLTRKFPKDELFGLTSQIKRAVVSIPSNIAEGSLRISKKDFIRFFHISYGSIAEVRTQIKIAERLSFITKPEAEKISSETKEISVMMNALLRSLKT